MCTPRWPPAAVGAVRVWDASSGRAGAAGRVGERGDAPGSRRGSGASAGAGSASRPECVYVVCRPRRGPRGGKGGEKGGRRGGPGSSTAQWGCDGNAGPVSLPGRPCGPGGSARADQEDGAGASKREFSFGVGLVPRVGRIAAWRRGIPRVGEVVLRGGGVRGAEVAWRGVWWAGSDFWGIMCLTGCLRIPGDWPGAGAGRLFPALGARDVPRSRGGGGGAGGG